MSQNRSLKLVTKLSPFLVTYLVLTELGDEFVTKFSEHQIRHQKWWQFCHQIQWSILWQYWWATNLVINFSPNLVNTNVGDKFSDKFVTLFSDHQIRWQICHRICHQICHQKGLESYMLVSNTMCQCVFLTHNSVLAKKDVDKSNVLIPCIVELVLNGSMVNSDNVCDCPEMS